MIKQKDMSAKFYTRYVGSFEISQAETSPITLSSYLPNLAFIPRFMHVGSNSFITMIPKCF